MKYKVLWLDDEFGIPKMDDVYDDIIEGGEYEDFEITICNQEREMETLFKDDLYQAVILDVIGPSNGGPETSYPFIKAMQFLDDKDVVVKVYSGNPSVSDDSAMQMIVDRGWREGKDFFWKQYGCRPLFDSLREDLKEETFLYKNREYLLDMFSSEKKYLSNNDQVRVRQLLKANWSCISEFSEVKAFMRPLLHNIMENLVYSHEDYREPYQFIPDKLIVDTKGNYVPIKSQGRFGSVCAFFWKGEAKKNYIKYYPKEKENSIELLKDIIQVACNICNKLDHVEDYEDCKEYFSRDDYMKVVFNSFFTILSWYYHHRESHIEE